MADTLRELSKGALNDLEGVFAKLPDDAADPLIEAIVAAKRIVVFGCGREGLQMRGFAMRLFHMGRDVSVWADMTTPPVGPSDLLFVSAGPGQLATAEVLVDIVTVIPAQTMADDHGPSLSVLPMGSLFETAQMIFFELVILKLRPRFHESSETMRARHTNLE